MFSTRVQDRLQLEEVIRIIGLKSMRQNFKESYLLNKKSCPSRDSLNKLIVDLASQPPIEFPDESGLLVLYATLLR
jgi:hypothetical protein